MSVNPDTTCAPGQIQQILEVLKQAHREMGLSFTEYRGAIRAPLILCDVNSEMITWVDPQGVCVLVFPITRDLVQAYPQVEGVSVSSRYAAVGEFIHRLNTDEYLKLWEFDCDNGDIRMSAYTDSLALTPDTARYKELFNLMTTTGATAIPYLWNVIREQMNPGFAADQARAALAAALDDPPEEFDDEDLE